LKVALVTGASGGIGSHIAQKLIENGYFTIATYNSDLQGINNLKTRLEKVGLSDFLVPIKVDLSDTKYILRAFSVVSQSFKHIDILVNNAGVDLIKQITDTTEEDWDRVFNINVKSAFTITNLVLPKMIERKQGKIVNISSVWGISGASCEVAYSASKSALIGYTKALAKELAPSNINCNCVCPGVIDTKMNAKFTKEELEDIKSEIPKGRLGSPNEIADLVYFLCSENSDYITGQIITADGGYIL
jgi:3-oxoacyl-[acyl-carrier protein] reductase